MTKIYVNIEGDSPEEVRLALEGLLGSERVTGTSPYLSMPYGSGEQTAAQGTSTSDVSDLSDDAGDTQPQRERGKPSPGKARRTKEEIAEDEAADKADAERAAAGAETGAEVADRQISQSPEDRQDPDNPQDAADEKAETEATKAASGKKLTHDDARAALGKYVNRFGMEAALEDGPKVLNLLFGEGVSKVSAIPDDQDSLAKAVAGIEEMLTKNPYDRKAEL
jgi:hypothetical protein